jgi:prepilin-type N-terminal cleavage/methylation domain-containing protein
MKRRGVTLVELLVVVALIAVLLALIIPAVQHARLLGMKLQIQANLRSVGQAMMQYASAHQGVLPRLADPKRSSPGDKLPLNEYVKYLQGESYRPAGYSVVSYDSVPCYRSPSDLSILEIAPPDLRIKYEKYGFSSISTNTLVHVGSGRMSSAAPDGASHTIYAGEHNSITFLEEESWNLYFGPLPDWDINNPSVYLSGGNRYSGFANAGFHDPLPVTSGNPPTTLCSSPGITFQHRPSAYEAKPGLLQSTLHYGLLVCMVDGSVRCISPSVSETVYWGAISPNGGEMTHLLED